MKNLWYGWVVLGLLGLCSKAGYAQTNDDLRSVVDGFFVAMEAQDTLVLDSLLHPQCIIFSTYNDSKGLPATEVLRKPTFLGFMRRAIAKHYIYDEQLWSFQVNREDNLATVWTEYTMFVPAPPEVSHCGVNTFTLAKVAPEQWQIIHIADTRRKEQCLTQAVDKNAAEQAHRFVDAWHLAAATADEDVFFGSMAEDAIYLGTDASERWLRDELKSWSAEYFKRDKAWDFKPYDRQLYWSDNQRVVWFEEMLDTWMGTCRGSGVLVRDGDSWLLKHYDLAVMVPNDVIKDFIDLVKKNNPETPPSKNK